MPTSPFRDEGERQRAREAAWAALMRAKDTLGENLRDSFDVLFPPIEPPPIYAERLCPKCVRYHKRGVDKCFADEPLTLEDINMGVCNCTDRRCGTPTPPDFDAALQDYDDANAEYDELMADDTTDNGEAIQVSWRRILAARQRVRELHEAVVRERDAWKEIAGTWADKWKLVDAALRAEVKPAEAGEEGWLVRWPGEALRTFWTKNPQGFTHYDSEVVRVRVVRVEEADHDSI